jgi:hypothetical protein
LFPIILPEQPGYSIGSVLGGRGFATGIGRAGCEIRLSKHQRGAHFVAEEPPQANSMAAATSTAATPETARLVFIPLPWLNWQT